MDEGERMKRKLATWVMLAAFGGGVLPAAHAGKFMSGHWSQPTEGASWGPRYAPEVSGYVGPYGTPVHQMAPGGSGEPTGADYAKAHLAQQYPAALMQQVGMPPPPPGLVPNAGYTAGPNGGSGIVRTNGTNPGDAVMHNPAIAGVPGVIPPGPPGAVAALGALSGGPQVGGSTRSEIRFAGPGGMKISWYAPRPDGKPGFTTQFLEAPARYNFLQSAIYRLKLSDIPNRPGLDLYPTLEVLPCNPKTATFLAHSAVPVAFTEEDFEQVTAGNFVVKVIYLPDPQFQDLAATGPDEVVSSRLEPGVDPILEAKRRGTILAVIRLGNIDLEAPNTPAMDAPDPKVQAMQQYQAMMMQQAAMQQAAMMRQQQGAGMPPNMGAMMGMLPPGMMPPGPAGAAMGPVRPGMMPPGMMPPPGMGGPQGPAAPTPPAPPAPNSPIGKDTTTPQPIQRTTLVDLAGKMFK
jgi:hypothetical protein